MSTESDANRADASREDGRNDGRRRGRATTYVRESYRLRAEDALDGFTPAARELFHLIAHLLDRFARDAVLVRQGELAEQLGYKLSAVEKGLRALRQAGVVEVEAVHGENGYRNKSRLTLPTMPEAARWFPS